MAAWPARCSVCGELVRKSESHAGSPGSPQPVRHLECALAVPAGRPEPRAPRPAGTL